MPPVAAVPANRPNGKLHGTVKTVPYKPAESSQPSHFDKKCRPLGGIPYLNSQLLTLHSAKKDAAS